MYRPVVCDQRVGGGSYGDTSVHKWPEVGSYHVKERAARTDLSLDVDHGSDMGDGDDDEDDGGRPGIPGY